MNRLLTIPLAATLLAALATSPSAAGEWLDLTHSFDASTVYWPTATPFRMSIVHRGNTPGGFWYESNDVSFSEHGGTHMDSPAHFARGAWRVDEVPLDVLQGEAVVCDISRQCEADPDYRLTAGDVKAWEARHGRILPGVIFLLRTGWGARWPDKARYLGTDRRGDTANLHFPGFSSESAQLLARLRGVKLVGIDTPSIDHGQSKDFPVHRVFGRANIPALENLAALERLPARGAHIVALPMKIGGGSGGPCRVIARPR